MIDVILNSVIYIILTLERGLQHRYDDVMLKYDISQGARLCGLPD